MTETVEELEPLFDYTRVQPLDLLYFDGDDDDCSSIVPSKFRKPSVSAAVDKVQVAGEVIGIDDDDDDLDWLAPPKVAVKKGKQCESSVLKELRMKKQELLSFTESAKDIVQTIEETVKRDLNTSLNSECESLNEKPSKPAVERPKVVISIQDKDGLKQFRIYKDDRFERLSDKVKNKAENLVFCFDGDKVDPTATPSSLELEDDDMIEVHVKSSRPSLAPKSGTVQNHKRTGLFCSHLFWSHGFDFKFLNQFIYNQAQLLLSLLAVEHSSY